MQRVFTDQMNREVKVNFPPKRIVSLVPSQTELLYDLGLKDEVVGQTLFCVHPQQMHEIKPRIGGTKKYDFAKIAALKPDLIIGNKEENEQEQIKELMKLYPVWMSDIQHLGDATEMIKRVGVLVDKGEKAEALSNQITSSFNDINKVNTLKTVYLIWRKPWMAAGRDTFINDMLTRCGFDNITMEQISRYPELTDEWLKTNDPEVILLSSEPYPFKEKHIDELQHLCPNAVIQLVDGELFSWYGSRLLKSVAYFKEVIEKLNINRIK